MPFGIDDAIGIGQAVINPVVQHFQNVKNRQFAREQYQTQRQDALSDWQMQNAYNSPAAQMQRFKDAGLNPHLIYGQGNVAQPMRSSSPQSSQGAAPRLEMRSMYQFPLMNLQKELSETQISQMNATIARQRVETIKAMSQIDLNRVGLKRANIAAWVDEQLKDTRVQSEMMDLGSKQIRNEYNQRQLDWQAQLASQGLNPLLQQILQSKAVTDLTGSRKMEVEARIKSIDQDTAIKEEEKRLRQAGASFKDPAWQRLLLKIVHSIFGDIFN